MNKINEEGGKINARSSNLVKPIIGKIGKFFGMTCAIIVLEACAAPASNVKLDDNINGEIIRSYLMANPEVIKDALIELEKKEKRAKLDAISDELYNNDGDFSVGPEDAEITIVEFFDYNCSYCKNTSDWVSQTIEKYPQKVRIIFKELPILDGRSKTSRYAAKMALAARKQGKYLDLHLALMKANGLSTHKIDKIASSHGLDIARLKEDISTSDYDDHIEKTMVLAGKIPGLEGTPFFVINGELVAGANIAKLQSILDENLS